MISAELRHDNHIGAVSFRLLNGAQDARRVARIIAVRRVNLPDGDAHDSILLLIKKFLKL